MSKVALARIPSLTFYKDAFTAARRASPIAQLICKGKPCNLYQPEVVRCVNLGGAGIEVEWKCEADLPDSLRFGRVEVSCEGWSGPGDSYVLKGSCGLEYRLVQVPNALRNGDGPALPSRWMRAVSEDPLSVIFMLLWMAILVFILYSMLKSCFSGRGSSGPVTRPNRPSGSFPGSGWFSGDTHPDSHSGPPPPYTKYSTNQTSAQNEGWRPGFWTGAAAGGLGAYLFNRREREPAAPPRTAYDWERDQRYSRPTPPSSGRGSGWGSAWDRQPAYSSDDRGEGPSNSGRMRSSVGLGGSNVR